MENIFISAGSTSFQKTQVTSNKMEYKKTQYFLFQFFMPVFWCDLTFSNCYLLKPQNASFSLAVGRISTIQKEVSGANTQSEQNKPHHMKGHEKFMPEECVIFWSFGHFERCLHAINACLEFRLSMKAFHIKA